MTVWNSSFSVSQCPSGFSHVVPRPPHEGGHGKHGSCSHKAPPIPDPMGFLPISTFFLSCFCCHFSNTLDQMIHCPFYAISWQKLLADQRRLKREQEEADIAARRHTGVIPTHHQFITNERFGDLLNIDDTAKRKSGSEVCFSCLSLLLDPKQYLPPH